MSQFRTTHQVFYKKRCSYEKTHKIQQENTCERVSFLIKLQVLACIFIKKETLVQVLSCEFCEIFKNTFFTDQLWVTAFVSSAEQFWTITD